jgi:hypothetical protein
VRVPDPRKRSPFETPVILTSAPRSSFFSATLVQTRLAQFLSTGPSLSFPPLPPETTDRNRTNFSPKSISRSPDPRSWIPPVISLFPSHALFSSRFPFFPSRPVGHPLSQTPLSVRSTRPLVQAVHHCPSPSLIHHQVKAEFNGGISYVFHAVSHASPRDAIHLLP